MVPSSCWERQIRLGSQRLGTVCGPGSAVGSPYLGVGAAAAPEAPDWTPSSENIPPNLSRHLARSGTHSPEPGHRTRTVHWCFLWACPSPQRNREHEMGPLTPLHHP